MVTRMNTEKNTMYIRTKMLLAMVLLGGVAACSGHEAPAATAAAAAKASSAVATAKSGSIAQASATASSCVKKSALPKYMGTYSVVAVKKYGGGLTSKAQAMRHMGKPMIKLSSAQVAVEGNDTIEHPRYSITCQPKPTEGEVVPPGQRYSNFYGFGTKRGVVSVLNVHDPADKDPTPYYQFELLHAEGRPELWYMDDGWLYELKPAP